MIKKIAYVCRWSMEKVDGVSQKIYNQIATWRDLGCDVQLFCRSPSIDSDNPESGIYAMPKFFSMWHRYTHIVDAIERFDPDIIYSRYEIPTCFSLSITKKYKERVVVEINSNEMQELRLLSLKNPMRYLPRFFLSSLTRSSIFKHSGCIVSPTFELGQLDDFVKFNKKIVVAPNSINLCEQPLVKKSFQADKVGHLLFLGSPSQPWHGIDKILALAVALGEKYHIHIVGPHREPNSPNNVTWHGYLHPVEYRAVAANCIAALSSMALYRNKMNEACTLKVRECIAMGLPIILAHSDTSFINHEPEWICQLPNDKESINSKSVEKIKLFLEKMKNRVVSHEESYEYIDSSVLEKKRIEAISQWLLAT